MKNVIFAGVGGQGVLLAGKVLMEVAREAGYDVKESEIHGMAQRGGSVECNVRFGEKVYSPLIPKGGADFIVTFELLESLRKLDYLAPEGTLIVNNIKIDPDPVKAGLMDYPDDIEGWLEKNVKSSFVMETKDALKEAGSKKALNIVMLGILSKYLEFTDEQWEDAIGSLVKEKFIDMNLKAFRLGKEL